MVESVVGGLPGRHRRSKVESRGLGIRREQLANSDHVVAQPLSRFYVFTAAAATAFVVPSSCLYRVHHQVHRDDNVRVGIGLKLNRGNVIDWRYIQW